MSKNKDIHTFYNMLMEKYKFYQDAITPFMQLRTKNEEEIKQIYQNLKTTFLDSNIYSPVNVYNLINNIFPYNNRYLTSYWSIFKMIYEDYHIKPDSYFEPVLKYFFYKENNLNIRAYDKKLFQKYENENYSLEVHEENTIYWAIMKDDLQLFISYALDSNFDKNQTLRSGLYPLINGFEQYSLLEICCYHGAVKCFKYLRSEYNMQITPTYLNFSFLSGVPEIMGECLKYQTPNDESMFFVIVSHNTDFLTFLINQYHLEMNLSYCAAFGNLNAFLIYFDMTKDVNDCFINSPLFYLPSLVEDFISFGVDINASDLLGKTAIIHAGLTNNRSAEILLSHGADINSRDSDGMTALHKAASNNYVEFMEFLIEHGADYNASDICKYSVLHFTTRYDSKDAAALLISYGANINAVDDTGKSTLLNAAQQDDFAIAELLISHGADINAKDYNNSSALHYAAAYNSEETADLLILHGAVVNARDVDKKTPLIVAAEYSNKEVAVLLILNKANVNAKDRNGKTALMYASEKGSIEIVSLLLSSGANTKIRDNFKHNALHYATISKNYEIANLLRQS